MHSLRISSVSVTVDSVLFTQEIVIGKLHFLYTDNRRGARKQKGYGR